jgi:hypothetical protein
MGQGLFVQQDCPQVFQGIRRQVLQAWQDVADDAGLLEEFLERGSRGFD